MVWSEERIDSWKELVADWFYHFVNVTPAEKQGYVFRGQSDTKWTLLPSLARLCAETKLEAKRAIELEEIILNRFQGRSRLYFDSHDLPFRIQLATDIFDWWTLMQHVRAPTRVLDWTHSPFVALYFAVVESWDIDGAIWGFQRVVHQENALAHFGTESSERMRTNPIPILRDSHAPNQVFAFDRRRLTDRMVAQQACFTISTSILGDHADAIADVTPEKERTTHGESVNRLKLVVPAALKPNILRQLAAMNVTAATLFPGADGLGREIAEVVRMAQ